MIRQRIIVSERSLLIKGFVSDAIISDRIQRNDSDIASAISSRIGSQELIAELMRTNRNRLNDRWCRNQAGYELTIQVDERRVPLRSMRPSFWSSDMIFFTADWDIPTLVAISFCDTESSFDTISMISSAYLSFPPLGFDTFTALWRMTLK